MTRQTYILIVSIYGFLLGISMLLLPKMALSYFGMNAEDNFTVGLMQFFGVLHIGHNYMSFMLRKTTDIIVAKAFLLGGAFILFASLGLGLYNVYGRNLPMHNTAWLDWSLWGVLGAASLYFWSKEK